MYSPCPCEAWGCGHCLMENADQPPTPFWVPGIEAFLRAATVSAMAVGSDIDPDADVGEARAPRPSSKESRRRTAPIRTIGMLPTREHSRENRRIDVVAGREVH